MCTDYLMISATIKKHTSIRKAVLYNEKEKYRGGGPATAAGVGAAALLKKKSQNEATSHSESAVRKDSNYRNTELGKHEKNKKGIYYTNGNCEDIARPEKPEGVDEKNAYIVGSGLAALSEPVPRPRRTDAGLSHPYSGSNGCSRGRCLRRNRKQTRGYVMRGGREMENHFECLWDLFRSIHPSKLPVCRFWMNITG